MYLSVAPVCASSYLSGDAASSRFEKFLYDTILIEEISVSGINSCTSCYVVAPHVECGWYMYNFRHHLLTLNLILLFE